MSAPQKRLSLSSTFWSFNIDNLKIYITDLHNKIYIRTEWSLSGFPYTDMIHVCSKLAFNQTCFCTFNKPPNTLEVQCCAKLILSKFIDFCGTGLTLHRLALQIKQVKQLLAWKRSDGESCSYRVRAASSYASGTLARPSAWLLKTLNWAYCWAWWS